MNEPYLVSFEIEGPAAMFTRPDTGAAQVSYPVPTWSAAKGMFDAVARMRSAFIKPTRVEICRPLRFERYVTNYRGPLRKSNQLGKDAAYQIQAMILVDVCYRIYGRVTEFTAAPAAQNHLHALQEIFMRRLAQGQYRSNPCLGWREFTASYIGPIRPDTGERHVQDDLEITIPSMLYEVFDKPMYGKPTPSFRQDISIVKGVLDYAQ